MTRYPDQQINLKDLLRYGEGSCMTGNERQCLLFLRIIFLAALPGIGISVVVWGPRILLLFLVSWISGLMVETIFCIFRKTAFHGSSTAIAALLVLLLPANTPLLPLALATAFALFLGQEVFGGAGSHIVNPVLLAKLFLMIGYLTDIQGPSFSNAFEPDLPWLLLTAGMVMILPLTLMSIIAPRTLFAVGGLALGAALLMIWMEVMDLMPYDSIGKTVLLDGFAFVVCFLLLDPAILPVSPRAGLAYGIIVGMLAFLIGTFSDKYSSGIVIALLFGNLAAPLLNQLLSGQKKMHNE